MQSVLPLLIKTRIATTSLQKVTDRQIKQLLKKIAVAIVENTIPLIRANQKDLALQLPDNPKNDRLLLDEQRIKRIAQSIVTISRLPDPSGILLAKRTLKNGLRLEKISVPLGVVGAIYESRPNVTFDIAMLCLRSRNGCVLKGSTDAENTNKKSVAIIKKLLKQEGFDTDLVTLLPSSREVVNELFTATKYIDVLIPRGSDGLIRFVRNNSQVPVIETGAGVCHVYVESKAAIKQAVRIVVNAKVSRPSVCNAMDTVLLDQSIAEEFLTALAPEFEKYKVKIVADKSAYKLLRGYSQLQHAGPEDYGQEFLSLKCAVKIVKDIEEALAHISTYSTRHSEAIVTQNKKLAERFIREVDAAVVYSNASTRFTDGEAFGLGAEIGISTQKLHARGPFALEKLVTEKWIIRGTGQIR